MKNVLNLCAKLLPVAALMALLATPVAIMAETVKVSDKLIVQELSAEPDSGLYKIRFISVATGDRVDFGGDLTTGACTAKKAAIYTDSIGAQMVFEMVSMLRISLLDNIPVRVGFDGCAEPQTTNGATVAKISWVQLQQP